MVVSLRCADDDAVMVFHTTNLRIQFEAEQGEVPRELNVVLMFLLFLPNSFRILPTLPHLTPNKFKTTDIDRMEDAAAVHLE